MSDDDRGACFGPFSMAVALALLLMTGTAAAGEPGGRLAGTVVRRGDDCPLAAKLFVEDGRGLLHVVPGEPDYQTQEWYAPNPPRFSYVEGSFSMPLSPGKYRVTAMKGYGYRDWERAVEVRAGGETPLRIEMERLVPLEEAGWYSGDLHIHGKTTLAMLRAEDVNVAAHTFYSTEKPRATKVYGDQCDATHLCCEDQEIEHWFFGNVFYFNIPTAVQDPDVADPTMTPMFYYDRQSHRMGGVNLRWLRARPFDLAGRGPGQRQPELAASAALGYMDVWSVMDNSMQSGIDGPRHRWTGDGWANCPLYEHTFKTWYRLLNCGLRITASAGTSYGRLSRLGFNRVYVRCPGGLSQQSFADGLKRGDGFVTNGPLLWLTADGKLPGDGVALDRPGSVRLSVRLSSKYPVELVEIVCNGKVVRQRRPGDLQESLAWEETAQVRRPAWFAARCFGTYQPRYRHSVSHNQFAHTNPLVVTIGGERPSSPQDAAGFLKEIDALIDFVKNIPAPLRAETLEVFGKARSFYADMAGQPFPK